VIGQIYIPDSFSHLIMMLLHDTLALVLLNGKATILSSILCSVRQGYPLVPYLFLLIGEALNTTASMEQRMERHTTTK